MNVVKDITRLNEVFSDSQGRKEILDEQTIIFRHFTFLLHLTLFSSFLSTLNLMTTINILLFVFYLIVTTISMSRVHSCYTEPYIETLHIRDCLTSPIEIETTRCRGQCYSQDFLIYDWKSEPLHYRHQHHIYCCSPNTTVTQEIQILCYNKQQRTIKYPSVKQCDCKLCTDNCVG